MELHEVRYFIALSRTLNFTRAAEQCHVSQPALTRAIRKMEDELGGPLFARQRRHTHLTELGRLIEPHLAEIMARAEAAKNTATALRQLHGGVLRLGVLDTIGPERFAVLLAGFRSRHPEVEIALHEGRSEPLSAALRTGEIDIALMAQPHGFALPLLARPLYQEQYVLACAAGHPLAQRDRVFIADLDGQVQLARSNCEYQAQLEAACAARGARLAQCFRGERADWILAMVRAGSGICFLPESCSTAPGVVTLSVSDARIVRDVHMVTVAGRRWSPPLAAFMQVLRHHTWRA